MKSLSYLSLRARGLKLSARQAMRKNRSGVALVLVLCTLVLITALAISLFLRVSAGRVFSGAYSKNVQARLLADTTVNIVIGQIRDATADGSLNWASQPGAIRTYDAALNFKGYKLYSSANMVAPNGVEQDETDFTNKDYQALLAGWDKKIGQYVDLNEPVYTYYKGTPAKHYPIVDPQLLNEDIVGFKLTDGTDELPSAPDSGADLGSPSTTSPSIKMPVEWLYVLKDGSLTAGTWQNGQVTFQSPNPVPSANNPIQARIAFWTDDETGKVNINTASEGLFWDTPRANSCAKHSDTESNYVRSPSSDIYNYSTTAGTNPATDYERGFAFIQPASKEYNRYPGHPAMNCLSVLLSGSNTNIATGGSLAVQTVGDIFAFAPILRDKTGALEGSQMGAHQVIPTDSLITLDSSQLYSSTDDAAMLSLTSVAPASPPQARDTSKLFTDTCSGGTTGNDEVTEIERRKFLMTTNSRAPELNIFNRPRIAMWPVHNPNAAGNTPDPLDASNTDSARRTAYDNLIAHCSTITNHVSGATWPFLFLRNNAYDQTTDMAINGQLYIYLNSLMKSPVPGWGGSFSSNNKYPNYKQLSIEMLDYIRCTNLFDSSLEGTAYGTNPNVATTGVEFTNGLGTKEVGLLGHGQVLPLVNTSDNVQGLGRTPTLGEVALAFICSGDGSVTTEADAHLHSSNKALGTTDLSSTQKQYQVMLLPKLVNPMPGNPNMMPSVIVEVVGLGGLNINGQTPYAGLTNFAGTAAPFSEPAGTLTASTPLITTNQGVGTWLGIGGGANLGIMPLVALATAPTRGTASSPGSVPADSPAPFDSYTGQNNTSVNNLMSNFFTISGGTTISLSCPDITINLYYQDPATGKKVGPAYQSFKVPLGLLANSPNQGNTPLPTFQQNAAGRGGVFNKGEFFWSFNRNGVATGFNHGYLDHVIQTGNLTAANPRPALFFNYLNGNEVVLSLQLKNGDYRTTAAMCSSGASNPVPDTVWQATPNSTNSTVVHTLVQDTVLPSAQVSSQYPTQVGDLTYDVQFTGPLGSSDTTANDDYFITGQWAKQQSGSLSGLTYNVYAIPNIPSSVTNSYTPAKGWYGDWDNGMGAQPDGPYSNLPDSGNMYQNPASPASITSQPPYFYNPSKELGVNTVFFSPNRMVPSSGMFGSLPTSTAASTITPTAGWRTLLFRPEGTTTSPTAPTAGNPGQVHPGAKSPPDHLLMDWFWMPVVDPYAISEPFSTAGKINMNYQILPFQHIVRETGLYSVLKAEKMMAIPKAAAGNTATNSASNVDGYKIYGMAGTNSVTNSVFRHNIDIAKTLEQFNANYFNANKPTIFKSASEICDQYLIPVGLGQDYTTMYKWWQNFQLTGDNSKERPYANIYPRLTTRSNTFTVHYRVQVLQKVKATGATVFVDPNDSSASGPTDQIMSEARGSYTIERYLQYDDPRFATGDPNFDPTTCTLNKAYKFRIVSIKPFNP